jgi:hypothetical protein
METGQLSYNLANANLESLGSSASVIDDISSNLIDRSQQKLNNHYQQLYCFNVECMDSENVRHVTNSVKDITIRSSLQCGGLMDGDSGPPPPRKTVRSAQNSEFKFDPAALTNGSGSAEEVSQKLGTPSTAHYDFHLEEILEEFKGSRSITFSSEDEPVLSKSQRRFEDLVQLQRYDGSWEPSEFVLKCITELHLDHPKDSISENQTEPQKLALLQAICSNSSGLATYCCLMLLLNCFQDHFQEIRLMIQKGIRFLLQKCKLPSNEALLRDMLQGGFGASKWRE